MAALQYVDQPNYSAGLFRRTYADLALPGALIPRSHEWLAGTDAKWNGTDKQWRFPSGAVLTFGYLESDDDKYRYQSSEFQFIGFDELTQILESSYRYMFSRLRRLKAATVPIRMRAASNPGGIGHDWVKQRFMVERVVTRAFVPARLRDNPHLDQEEYTRSLMELDPITRQQLLNGDWTARQAGGKFKREWFEIVDAAPADLNKVRWWDLAASEAKPGKDPDWTAGCLYGRSDDGIYYLCDMKRTRSRPLDVERLVRQTAELDGKGVSIWMEQEPGSSGVNTIDHYIRQVIPEFDFHGERSTGPKESYANPASSQAEVGNVKLVRGPWVGEFLDEVEAFPLGAHDDQVDAFSKAHSKVHEGGWVLAV